MLPARHRLRRSADFGAAVRAVRAGSRTLVVHATRQPTRVGEPVRVGFVVSKAVGNAVVRNRAKRRLRALVGDRLTVLPPGVDVVVRANPAAAHADTQELAQALERGLARTLARLEEPERARSAVRPGPASTVPAAPVRHAGSKPSRRGAH